MSFQHTAKLASEDRLSSSQTDFCISQSDEVSERLLGSHTDITQGDVHQERPSSLISKRDHILTHSRTSSAGTVHGPTSSLKFHGLKRPSSQTGPTRIFPTKMFNLAKKHGAEQGTDDETDESLYLFKMDRTKDKGFNQSVSLPGFFSSYSPILYLGDVESFDSILLPSPTPSTSPTTTASPTREVFSPPRSGSATPTTVDPVQLSRKGKRAELARALRKAVKEAKDACRWLNAAGFPQYVQMFEDGHFPINLSRIQVEKDHAFLEQADIDALIRRLNILNRCADKMDEIRLQFEDSDDESNSRALSDKWHFRRRQRKWSRRSECRSISSNQGNPHQESLFSSCEDLLQDSNGASWEAGSTQSPLMLVSELRNSLTGLDRAVKTYSFMLNDEQVPTIQVESPGLTNPDMESGDTLQKMSSYFSSLDSDEDEAEAGQDDDYPSGSMDNFATGILDALETNLLKLKDYTTRSLPDVFKESTASYHEDVSCEVSPLSSASASTTSIADSIGMAEPPSGHHQAHQFPPYTQTHPLADHHTYDPMSLKSDSYMEAEVTHQGPHTERRLIPVLLDADKRGGYPKLNGAGGGNHSRMFSADSLGACSLAESEYSERDISGFSSSSPVPSALTISSSKVPARIPNGIGGGDYASTQNNGREHRAASRGGEVSPLEELAKRISKTSISSSSNEPLKRVVSKWHSYQRPHSFRASFRPVRTLIPIEELSVGQISVLRKLCLIKITALIELYRGKANIAKLVKSKSKKPGEAKSAYPQGKKVFGVPLSVNVRRTGKALPATIHHAINFLSEESSLQTMGLFRRAASKAKVDLLKELMEEDPDYSDFSDFTAYDVADTVKVYFRELPEPLLTSKFSELLITLQESVPTEELRLPALQGIVLLLPDEHREALQVLLCFLRSVAQLCDTNQMTPQNLAVCFAPTLFSLTTSVKPMTTNSLSRRGSFRRNNIHVTLTPEQVATNKEISESVASSHCLTEMICAADRLFKVAADMLQVCRFTHLEMGDPVPYYELMLDRRGTGSMNVYLDGCVQTVLREVRKKFKNWTHVDTVGDVDVSCLKLSDGVPLRVWRGSVDIDASNTSVYLGMWADRSLWDHNVVSPKLVTKIDEQTEVFQYSTPEVPPFGKRDHCLLRSWQFDVASSSYILVSTSVSHPQATLQGGIRATHLFSSYLIEALDNEHCRLTHLCRMDMRGRSAEYYNKCYGPYLASTVSRVRDVLCSKGGLQETSV